jgi:cap1 methyltransferase
MNLKIVRENFNHTAKINFYSTTGKTVNQSLSNSYASSEDEQNKRLNRLDSTTSYTSGEDEPNKSFGYTSQTSENESISYYNPCDDDPQRQYYNPEASVKRSFSYTSDEGDDNLPYKRQKLSESTESPYPSDTEQTTQIEAPPRSTDNGQSSTQQYDTYSGASKRMMEMMGFKKDKGLGKQGQGRLEPIIASQQKGRRGLGLRLDDLDRVADKWDSSIEELFIPEKNDWLDNTTADDNLLNELTADTLQSWTQRGPRKSTIDNETKFCDENILKRVLEGKSVFDNLGAEDMRRARTKSNPFETIRGNIFLNRAAVKMANMDSMFDYMFSNPVDESGESMLSSDDILYFADVCAGPGGFSEYILYRKKWEAKGFGFTLKSENDFKLHDFFVGPPETFCPYYGINEDGNVYNPDNIKSLEELIRDETESGVHFMMADGGFSVEGQENIQEILSKQLYLAQCLVALTVVRTKGHFVVKLFDLFTPFSVSLIYLMYKCFKKICICKPNTSRPANSERYLVCKWKKPYTDTIVRNLKFILTI